MSNPIYLDDFICEIVDDEKKISRFNMYFQSWIKSFDTLKRLTEKIDVYDNVEILIKDKYQFLDELHRLTEVKLIKSSMFKR